MPSTEPSIEPSEEPSTEISVEPTVVTYKCTYCNLTGLKIKHVHCPDGHISDREPGKSCWWIKEEARCGSTSDAIFYGVARDDGRC